MNSMAPSVVAEAIKLEKERRSASASLYEFVRQSWHVVEPGVPFVASWHIQEICEHLEAISAGDIRKLLINIPPRHSKSTIVSVIWPMWENAKQRFENSETGYRIATSVGGTATGEGGSRLLLDDPHAAQEAQSDAIRESSIDWFDQVWSTRLNDPKLDAMVCVMQRLHEQDISGHILEDIGGWEHLMIPAEWGAGSG